MKLALYALVFFAPLCILKVTPVWAGANCSSLQSLFEQYDCEHSSTTTVSGPRSVQNNPEPSFNCKFATHSDEIAICGSETLAQLDRGTSKAFHLLRRRPELRTELLAITRQFLKSRRACGGDTSCIADAQKNVLRSYSDLEEDKDVSGNHAAAADTNARENNSQRWADAYSRRNFKLGMTLSQFRKAPFPDQKQWPHAFPFCSNPSAPLENELSFDDFDNPYQSVGAIKCVFVYWDEWDGQKTLSDAGLMLGAVSSVTSFYFLAPETNSEPVLFSIVTLGNSHWYEAIRQEFKDKLGEPQTGRNTVQNGLGNTFQNQVSTYDNSSSEIVISRYSDTIERFVIMYTLTDVMDRVHKLERAIERREADRL